MDMAIKQLTFDQILNGDLPEYPPPEPTKGKTVECYCGHKFTLKDFLTMGKLCYWCKRLMVKEGKEYNLGGARITYDPNYDPDQLELAL
jgi:hypothetical protein